MKQYSHSKDGLVLNSGAVLFLCQEPMIRCFFLWSLRAPFHIFSKAKYGDMQSFVKKLEGMGYRKVELIDTTNGKFMEKSEAVWMGLSGSAILTGIK